MYNLASSTWDQEEVDALLEVAESQNFTMGTKVQEFESKSATYFGAAYSTMVNSGSSANLVALTALSIQGGFYGLEHRKEVLVPAVSWSTTYYPINQANFNIRFIDIDPDTLNIDLEKAHRAINSETAGIVGSIC